MDFKCLQLDGYEIISVVSRGGFGITYKARRSDGRIVCIKEYFPESICKRCGASVSALNSDGEELFGRYKKSFIKEALTLKQLSCASIVKVFDVFEKNNTAYYVMEYIDGKPLSEIIPPHGFDEATALCIIKKLLEAVGYIHVRKITHLDIKPSNILVRDNGDIVLIDFGGSKRYTNDGEQTSSSPLSTSEGFAPIELYTENGLKEFSPATDIYEVGATLYNLITGKCPPSASEIMDEGNLVISKDVSQNIKNAITLAMEPGITYRLKSVEEFSDVLNNKGRNTAESHATEIDPFGSGINSDATEINSDATEIDTHATEAGYMINPDTGNRRYKKKSSVIKYIGIGCAVVLAVVALILNRACRHTTDADETVQDVENTVDSVSILRNELQKFVDKENAKPQTASYGITIDSLAFTQDGLEYYASISPEGKVFYDEMKNSPMKKDIVITALRNDKALLRVCKKLVLLDLDLIWHYKYAGKDEITIVLTSEDLKSIKGYEGSKQERNLQMFSETANNISRQCPQNIDDGLTMVNCVFDGSTMRYVYKCSTFYFNYIKQNRADWETEMENNLNSDQTMKMFTKVCAENNVNIVYDYQNESNGKSVILTYNTSTNKFI